MTNISRRGFLGLIAAGAVMAMVPWPARAQSLAELKRQGLVGEMPNGYVGLVRLDADAEDAVDRINAERRQSYRDIAAGNGVPLEAVEQRAGAQLISRASPGEYIMNAAGEWVRK